MPPSVAALKARLRELAALGYTLDFATSGRWSCSVPGLSGAASTRFDNFEHNVDGVVLAPVACGESRGLLGVVCSGNEKHEPSVVSSALAAVAFCDAFAHGLLSEADIAPALRRAMLSADAAIREIQDSDPSGFVGETLSGRSRSLAGIGASVTATFALPDALYVAQVGDSSARLLRDGSTRLLTVANTLGHDAEFRKRVAEDPEYAVHQRAVLRVLGCGPEPEPTVTKAALRPGDRILVGNSAIETSLEAAPVLPNDPAEAVQALERRLLSDRPWTPASVIVLGTA